MWVLYFPAIVITVKCAIPNVSNNFTQQDKPSQNCIYD